MDLELKGRVALVTGSSRGIGEAIARTLQQEGCQVVINGRDASHLAECGQRLGLAGVAGDMSVEADAQAAIQYVVAQYGALDILVCNVGSGASVPAGQEDGREWERMLGLNLHPAVNAVAAARTALGASKGVALCISSICGSAALGAPLAYSAAKSALNSYVRGISRVLAREGVRINALSPGNIIFEGSSWDTKMRTNRQAVQTMLDQEVALRRLGSAQEIANVAAFMCSPKNSFMTGEVVVVDGGQLRS